MIQDDPREEAAIGQCHSAVAKPGRYSGVLTAEQKTIRLDQIVSQISQQSKNHSLSIFFS